VTLPIAPGGHCLASALHERIAIATLPGSQSKGRNKACPYGARAALLTLQLELDAAATAEGEDVAGLQLNLGDRLG